MRKFLKPSAIVVVIFSLLVFISNIFIVRHIKTPYGFYWYGAIWIVIVAATILLVTYFGKKEK